MDMVNVAASVVKNIRIQDILEPVDLQNITSSMTVALKVNAVSGASFPDGKSAKVQVAVRVKPKEPNP